jgi:hypothetical protein
MSIEVLTAYGQELVAAGFEVWLTKTGDRHGGYLQYRDPATGCCGSLQHIDHEGWQHLMPIIPSRENGSSMFISKPLWPFTVEAARQCAQPSNRNDVVGQQANARDRTWRSDNALALHGSADTIPTPR